MIKLEDATPKQLFKEIRKRLKNEITNRELTDQLWEYMEPDEEEIKGKVETVAGLFRLLTKIAYLPDLATIRELNELQREARHLLSTEFKQFHNMGV